MNKIVEIDFLPRELDSPWPNLAPGVEINEKRRILILDNNRDTTHLVKILLEKTGDYLVLEENDSTKAQQSARNFRPDLIVLNIVMLRADGGEIAAQIRADPDLQHTPIIFVTALVTRTEANAGLRTDGHPFLAKAIDIQELIKSIDENLSARASS